MAQDFLSLRFNRYLTSDLTKSLNDSWLDERCHDCANCYVVVGGFLPCLFTLCDGIDGSVAIFQKRDSAWGATLDSVVDRISEALWLYALYVIGIPAWLAITLWSVAAFQEYARAKLSSLDVADIGVVTPAERPVRASFLFITLIVYQLSIPGVVFLAYGFLALQVVSFTLVVRFARSQLH